MTTPDDLAVFYDLDEFALSATRTRPGVDAVTFAAIPGVVDDEALEGHVMAARRRLAFVTGHDVIDGDTVTLVGTGALATYNGQYRVIDPKRVNDGLETVCHLAQI